MAEEKLLSSKAFARPLIQTVSDDSNETLCGWRNAKPCPEYRILPHTTKKHKKLTTTTTTTTTGNSSSTLPSTTRLHQKNYSMNGKLTDNYDYIYEGKKTTKTTTQTKQSETAQLVLNPVIINRSDSMSNSARDNIHRLAQLQLKPDVAYEQLIIDEKLKTINLNSMCEFRIKGLYQNRSQSDADRTRHNKSIKKLRNPRKPRALDWSILKGHNPSFKNDLKQCKPVLKSSFSRLLESSSVIYSYKK